MRKFTKICLWTALVTVCVGAALAIVGASLGGIRQSREALRNVRADMGFPVLFAHNDWDWDDDYDDFYDDDHYDDRDDYYDDYYDDDYYDDDYPYAYPPDGTVNGANSSSVKSPATAGSPAYFSAGEDICRADEIRDVEVRVRKGIVDIKLYDGENFRFETEEPQYFKVYREGYELNVYSNHRTGNSEKYKIILYLPRTAVFNEVKVDVGAGVCTVDGVQARDLDVDAGAGEVVLTGVTADEADLNTGAGTLSMDGVIGRKLEVDCGVGNASVNLNQREDEFNYKLQCAVGQIRIGGETYTGLGGTKKINNNASKEISVDCGVGEVSVEFSGK